MTAWGTSDKSAENARTNRCAAAPSTIAYAVRATYAADPMKTCLLSVAALVIAAIVTIAISVRPASAACNATPRSGCKVPFVPHQSTLTFRQTIGHDPDDILTWRWLAGSQTTVDDFGDPPTTDYALCIYDQSPRTQPVIADSADDPRGWAAVRGEFVYLVRGSHPLRTVRLHAGVDGKANVRVHGNVDTGASLLPFVPPVTVQLQASNAQCWETDFAAPARNDALGFRAKD